MAVGKNKKAGKGKKGGKKKTHDPFLKKEWYDIRTPVVFPTNQKTIGKTIATKTAGTKVARDTLMGRIFEASQGDLKPESEDDAFRKFRLRVEDVQGFNVLTQFHGMSLTTDKLRSLVRKWQTLIEAFVDIRTSDGYALRLFVIGFTRKHRDQVKKTAYAQKSQTRAIRKRMREIMAREGSGIDLNTLVQKLMTNIIGVEIEKHTQAIYPLKDVLVRKVKMLRSPKADVSKLIEAHGGADALAQLVAVPAAVIAGGADAGAPVQDGKDGAAPAAAASGAEAKKEEKKEDKGKDGGKAKDGAKDKGAAKGKDKDAAAGDAGKKAAPKGGDKGKKGNDKSKAMES